MNDSKEIVINLTSKKITIIIMSLQLAFMGSVLFDKLEIEVPVLRQFIGFIYLMFIPGFLILRVLRVNTENVLSTFLYSVGLSLSFLMFIGVLINFLYPIIGIYRVISEIPLVVTFSIAIIFLCCVYYLRDRNYSVILSMSKQTLFNPFLLFFLLLPFISIIGVYIFNLYSDNILLLILLMLISLTPLFVIFNKISQNCYPFAIWMISLSLLFHRSLAIGFEPSETIFPGIVKSTGRWDPSIPLAHNHLLPNVILFPSLFSVLDIATYWGLKIVPPFIISFVPLILYQVFTKIIDSKGAFLSVFLYMSMFPFYRTLIGVPRVGMAIFFFSLLVLMLTENRVDRVKKFFLSVVFTFYLIASHYATSYLVMFVIITSTVLLSTWKKLYQNKGKTMLLTPNFAILYILLAISWYMFTASSSGFILVTTFIKQVFGSISEFMNPEASYSAYIIKQEFPSFTLKILKYFYILIIAFTTFGILSEIYNYFTKRNMSNVLNVEYIFLSIMLLGVLLTTFLPTSGYNTARVIMIIFVTLSPFFIISIISIFNVLNKVLKLEINQEYLKRNSYIIISLILINFFLLNSGFISEVILKDYAPSTFISKERIINSNNINAKAYLFKEEYKPPMDFLSSDWILTRGDSEKTIYGDQFMTWRRLRYRMYYIPEYNLVLLGKEKPTILKLEKNITIKRESYIILGYHNLKEKILFIQYHPTVRYFNISSIHNYLLLSSKIYTNGGSEIYYYH